MRAGEGDDLACRRIGRIDQLERANDLVIQRLHRDGQERGRPITVGLVESARTGEVESPGVIGIRDIDGFKLVDRVAHDLGQLRRSIGAQQIQWRKADRPPAFSAEMDSFAAGMQYLELQSAIFGQAIDRPAVRTGDRHRRLKDDFKQAMDILFTAEQRGDL